MATSNEKLKDLATRLPEFIAEAELPWMMAATVAGMLPMFEDGIAEFLSRPPEELDAMIVACSVLLLALRSDDAAPLEETIDMLQGLELDG